MGKIYREFLKDPETSMPEYIGAPVNSPKDWESVKKRLIPNSAQRYPADWDDRIKRWKKEKPVLN